MPYAHNGRVSQDPIDGGIPITQKQYAQAVEGMLNGLEVTIDRGFKVAPKPDPARQEPPDPAPPPAKIFSVREFRARFTRAEQIAIRAASMTDHDVGLVYDEFLSAQYIDLDDPAVEQGVSLYVAKGLIAASRKTELMA